MLKNYYRTHSFFSDPGDYVGMYDAFSENISELTKQVQQLFLHYADLNLLSISVDEKRYAEMNFRYIKNSIEKILLLDLSNLISERRPKNRVMGVCRDTSLLLCSILRSRDIEARLRSGFVNYFIPGLFLDGFCVEIYDEKQQRWRSIDTRTTQMHIDHYHLPIDFDLMDVPNTKFISAADAWQMCRFENADAVRFGSRQQRGLFTIRNRLIQDLALLNKQEPLIWDAWGPMLTSAITNFDLLDELSHTLIADVNDTKKITAFYDSNPGLQFPKTILVDNPFLNAEWITL